MFMSQLKKIVNFTESQAQKFEHFPLICVYFILLTSHLTSDSTCKSDAYDQAKREKMIALVPAN